MGRKKKQSSENLAQVSNNSKKKNTIFGIDLANFNINSEWINQVNFRISPKTCFNILLINCLFLSQLTLLNGFSTEMAMQSEIHRTIMRIINSEEINCFITAVVIGSTEQYSKLFKTEDIAERFNILKNARGARNSRFNNVIPSIGMTQDALLKYTIGYRFSIKGILSTHPIFFAHTLINWYGLKSLDVKLADIETLTDYKDEFKDAILFIKKKISEKNPHLENVSQFNVTPLQKELGLIVESTQTKVNLDLLPENQGTEEERQRARLINEQILKTIGQ